MNEYRTALKLLESNKVFEYWYPYTTMLKYQYHFIACCNDIGNFELCDLHGHSDTAFSSFVLQTKVYWSKNVQEERDCPDQILLGCQDVDYCILLAPYIYLEIWLIAGAGATSTLLFLDEIDDDGARRNVVRCKKRYMDRLSSCVFENEAFRRVGRDSGLNDRLGTHSIRKYPATFARSS